MRRPRELGLSLPPHFLHAQATRAGSNGLKHAPPRIYNVVLRVSLSDGLLFSKKYWRALSFLSRPIAVRVLCHANDQRSTECHALKKFSEHCTSMQCGDFLCLYAARIYERKSPNTNLCPR
jgi:hypothetical protein